MDRFGRNSCVNQGRFNPLVGGVPARRFQSDSNCRQFASVETDMRQRGRKRGFIRGLQRCDKAIDGMHAAHLVRGVIHGGYHFRVEA